MWDFSIPYYASPHQLFSFIFFSCLQSMLHGIYNLESRLMKLHCIQIRHVLRGYNMWLYQGSSLLRLVDICYMYISFYLCQCTLLGKILGTLVLIFLSAMKVEVWDLKSAEKFVQLPSNIPSSSSNVCNKDRGLFLLYMIFELNFLKIPSFWEIFIVPVIQ